MQNSPHWRKLIFGCTVGNVLELYDFVIYSYFANILVKHFFPPTNQYTALLLSFSVFASGCLMRPFGSMAFGYYGDRFGRRKALLLSVGMIAISTACIGLLPTYQQIGIYAPLALIACRLIQGISMCGEEVGAAIYLSECAPANKRCLAPSIIMGSVFLGLLLGSCVALFTSLLLNDNQLMQWGWRMPFLSALVLGTIALTIRIRQGESVKFLKAKLDHQLVKQPLNKVFKEYTAKLIYGTLLAALLAISVYILAVYMPNVLIAQSHISLHTSMIIFSTSFLLAALITITVGYWADHVGPKLPMLIGSIGFIVLAYPIFNLLNSHSLINFLISQIIITVLLGFIAGMTMRLLITMFPTQVRFSGVAICFNISMTLFGSTGPIIILLFNKMTGNPTSAFYYLSGIAIMTLIGTIKTQGASEETLLPAESSTLQHAS